MNKPQDPNRMTRTQQKVYQFVAQYIEDYGYPPSVREICTGLDFKSPSTAHFHLQHLYEKGFINKEEHRGRALQLTDKSTPLKTNRSSRIPVLGRVAAGTPILAQEYIEDYICLDVGPKGDEYFGLKVIGESMINAGILPGDVVIVHRQLEAHNGEIIVALLDDEATVKRLYRNAQECWLLPENDNYGPIDGRKAVILGKVTNVVRTYH